MEPYLIRSEVIYHKDYNPDYGDSRVCTCGHKYYRHFDSYGDFDYNIAHPSMEAIGCKYCPCDDFKEAK